MRVNLSAADSGFDALPSGKYLVKITDGELRESGPNAKHPGAQYINWEFTIQSGDFEGRRLWSNTTISHEGCDCNDEDSFNKSLGTIVQLLKAVGYTNKELDSDKFDLDIDNELGKDVVVVVNQREYEGEMRNDIKRYRPAGDLVGADASLLP